MKLVMKNHNIYLTGEASMRRQAVLSVAKSDNDEIGIYGWVDHNDKKIGTDIYVNNEFQWCKHKSRLTSHDLQDGFSYGQPKYLCEILDMRILVILCKEILFPEDFWEHENVDLVVHQIGYEMHSKDQRKAWFALQKSLILHFDCPVACCVNNDGDKYPLTGWYNKEILGREFE